jgi:hypothetical protein
MADEGGKSGAQPGDESFELLGKLQNRPPDAGDTAEDLAVESFGMAASGATAPPAPPAPTAKEVLSSAAADFLPTSKDEAPKPAKTGKGCLALAMIPVLVALVFGIVSLLPEDKEKTKTSGDAASETSEPSSDAPMDGHWVLASGLQNPKGLDTSLQGFGPGAKLDPSSATIDISGAEITGGTYKTGITHGDGCQILESKVDLKASGGVDQAAGYGQLVLDGLSTTIKGCDTNHQPVVESTPSYHTAHYFYVKGDTLYLCYSINTTTFDSCTDPAGGSAATFKRG